MKAVIAYPLSSTEATAFTSNGYYEIATINIVVYISICDEHSFILVPAVFALDNGCCAIGCLPKVIKMNFMFFPFVEFFSAKPTIANRHKHSFAQFHSAYSLSILNVPGSGKVKIFLSQSKGCP
jgi:hypothetical protein